MYPHERSLVKQLSDQPFAIIGVNADPILKKIQTKVKDKNITWRSFWNGPEGPNGRISTRWNVTSWPTIYILDANGVIRYKDVQGDDMDRAVETLLAEMGHKVKISHEEAKSADEKDGVPSSN